MLKGHYGPYWEVLPNFVPIMCIGIGMHPVYKVISVRQLRKSRSDTYYQQNNYGLQGLTNFEAVVPHQKTLV